MKKNILIALISFIIASLTVLFASGFLFNNSTANEIIESIPNVSINQTEPEKKSKSEEKISILLLGIGGEEHEGANLTDTIMVAEIDNVNQTINLISLPRDFLVFYDNGFYSKINSLYSQVLTETKDEKIAISALQDKVFEITGIKTDHYAKVDFKAFTEIVDTIGGVDVNVLETIDDKNYPGPNFSYEPFYIEAGPQKLDGKTALKYARSRYSSKGGDLDRARRQQEIITEIKNKILDLNPIMDISKVVSLISIAQQNIDTDLSFNAMRNFYDTYQDIDNYKIQSLVIGSDLLTGVLKEGTRVFGSNRGFILEPRIGEKNYLQIQEEVQNIANIDSFRESLKEIKKENISIALMSTLSREDTLLIQELLDGNGIKTEIIKNTFDEITYKENKLLKVNVEEPQNININESETVDLNSKKDNFSEKYLLDKFDTELDIWIGDKINKDYVLYITNVDFIDKLK